MNAKIIQNIKIIKIIKSLKKGFPQQECQRQYFTSSAEFWINSFCHVVYTSQKLRHSYAKLSYSNLQLPA